MTGEGLRQLMGFSLQNGQVEVLALTSASQFKRLRKK
jgi:hypothetical protein